MKFSDENEFREDHGATISGIITYRYRPSLKFPHVKKKRDSGQIATLSKKLNEFREDDAEDDATTIHKEKVQEIHKNIIKKSNPLKPQT